MIVPAAELAVLVLAVCRHYGLSDESTTVALSSARERPEGSYACYASIARSLGIVVPAS